MTAVPFYVARCGCCKHVWIALHVDSPILMRTAAKVLGRLICPKCGNGPRKINWDNSAEGLHDLADTLVKTLAEVHRIEAEVAARNCETCHWNRPILVGAPCVKCKDFSEWVAKGE
jgi:hypothetical protein